MKNNPQLACEGCNDLLRRIGELRHGLMRAKRLPPEEMAGELNALQVDFGALEAQARELKTFVTVAFATSCVREVVDRVVPRVVPQFPEHAEA